MFKITMSTHKSTAINFVARASRRNRDCVATHLFTFLNHFNLWTLTSACDALATCYLYVNTLREHEQQVHTRIKHRTLSTLSTHEHCNHRFLLHTNIPLNLFISSKYEPDRIRSPFHCKIKLTEEIQRKKIIWNREKGSRFFRTKIKNHIQEKANFF